jgi:chloramphenicol O-acetyltransferase type A
MSGKKVDINEYKYKDMYERFTKEDDPGVCVTGTFDITNLIKIKKKGHSLNALLCYVISKAGESIDEYHYMIKEDGLYYYDDVKVNAVFKGKDNSLCYGSVKYFDNFLDFEKEYKNVREYCYEKCEHYDGDFGSMLSTSAVTNFPFESFSLSTSKTFWDHFLMWGKYTKKWFKYKLTITLRFHHALIDGEHAGMFFNELQKQINELKI